MSLWKRLKEKRSEKPTKAKNGKKSVFLPESVLIWIDAAHCDPSARMVRGLVIAEMFHKAGMESVTLACLEHSNLPSEAEKRNIQWINSRPNGTPLTFNEIVKTANADLVIADSATPPRLQGETKVALLALLADGFSIGLLESSVSLAKAALLPGLIVPPDFETETALPSQIGDCIHGLDYVPLPCEYSSVQSTELDADQVLIAMPGNVTPEALRALLSNVKSVWSGGITVLADVAAGSSSVKSLRDAAKGEIELLIEPAFSERLAAIQRAKLVLAYPSLVMYELLGLGKALILLPRNDAETQVCRLALEQKVVRVVPSGENGETLALCMKELLEKDEVRRTLGDQAAALIPTQGAQNIVNVLLARFSRAGGRQKGA